MSVPTIKQTLASLDRLMGHTMATLPDSLSQRKTILADILVVLPMNHPRRRSIREMLLFLEEHERQQGQLALDFSKPEVEIQNPKPSTK